VELKTKSNDRLEFVGDGVLECVTKHYLYMRFPKDDEGFMTETKISIVKNESLGQIVLDMGLEKWYILSKNADAKHIRTNASKLGNLFEAFLGAIFLDFNHVKIQDSSMGLGFQMAERFLNAVFERHVNWSKILENNENYKNKLQVMIQKEFKCVPYYLEIFASLEAGYCMGVYLCLGQDIHQVKAENALTFPAKGLSSFADIHQYMLDHRKIFLLLGKGQKKKKKKAEQLACENALRALSGKPSSN
jgi:dsRNA-specific ribonuclease